jgi:hypothetical protein
VSAGTCDITASQAGNSTVVAATSVTRTLTINKATQAITFAALANVTYSSTKVGLNTSASSTLVVVVESNDSTVCSLSGSLVTLLKAGTCSLTASQAGTGNYEVAPTVTRTFQIAKAGQSVTFTVPEFLSLGLDQAVDLNGNTIQVEADELLARLFQHELDHLNGVLMFDRMTPEQREEAMQEYKRIADGGSSAGETRHIGLK